VQERGSATTQVGVFALLGSLEVRDTTVIISTGDPKIKILTERASLLIHFLGDTIPTRSQACRAEIDLANLELCRLGLQMQAF